MTVVAGNLIAGIESERKTRKVAVVVVDQYAIEGDDPYREEVGHQVSVVTHARSRGMPVLFVESIPQGQKAKPTDTRLTSLVTNPRRIEKKLLNAFDGTTLYEELQRDGVRSIVLIGGAANHCVRLTAVGGSQRPPRRGEPPVPLHRPVWTGLTGVTTPPRPVGPSAPTTAPTASTGGARVRRPLPAIPKAPLTREDIMYRAVRPLDLSPQELSAQGLEPVPFTQSEHQLMAQIKITNSDGPIFDLVPDATMNGATQHGFRVLTCNAVLYAGPAGQWTNSDGVQFYQSL